MHTYAYTYTQVHRATYQGKPVAVKVQRAGLKELFDTDLKNLKVCMHACMYMYACTCMRVSCMLSASTLS